eukprot:2068555-Prymnesium_polylepis.1
MAKSISRVPASPDMGECRGRDTDQYTGIILTGQTGTGTQDGSGTVGHARTYQMDDLPDTSRTGPEPYY